jgi:hypothetical protein
MSLIVTPQAGREIQIVHKPSGDVLRIRVESGSNGKVLIVPTGGNFTASHQRPSVAANRGKSVH